MNWRALFARPDTPTDHAGQMLQDFFHSEGIEIKVSVDDREDPDVKLLIQPGFGDSLMANQADFILADNMAERTQKVGFILGQMSHAPTKPRSIEITHNTISAPNGQLLKSFIEGWVAEQNISKGM